MTVMENQKSHSSWISKNMTQILGFPKLLFFLWISILWSSNQKTELDGMFIFYADFFTFCILADKISRSAIFWFPIQNLNSVPIWETPYLNWRYDFVRLSRGFVKMHELRASLHTWKLCFLDQYKGLVNMKDTSIAS